jgi:hypothetical protein
MPLPFLRPSTLIITAAALTAATQDSSCIQHRAQLATARQKVIAEELRVQSCESGANVSVSQRISGMVRRTKRQGVALLFSLTHQVGAARRSGGDLAYAEHCLGAGSAFRDSTCNCLGESAHPKLASRHPIRILFGSWCVHLSASRACHRLASWAMHA